MMGIGIFELCELLSILRYILLFYWIFGLRPVKDRKRIVIATVIFLIGVFLLQYSVLSLPYFLELLFFLFVLIFLFDNNAMNKAGFFLLSFLWNNFMEEIIAIFLGFVFSFNPLEIAEHGNMKYRIFTYVMIVLIYLLLGIFYGKKVRNKFFLQITRKEYLLFALSFGCAAMLASLLSYIAFSEDKEVLLYYSKGIALLCVVTTVVMLLLFVLIAGLIRKREMQREWIELLHREATLQKEYYQRLYEKNEEMRSFRHDYHHHISYLISRMERGQYEEALQYLYQLHNVGLDVLNIREIYSGNSVIDAVIYSVLSKKENQEIIFSYKGRIPNQLCIDDVDLCVVLANLLENATEACKKCEEKRIDMTVMKYNSNLIIRLCNTYSAEHVDIAHTCKEDKRQHGYGVRNIKQIVEKYTGNIKHFEEKGYYHVIIQINETD